MDGYHSNAPCYSIDKFTKTSLSSGSLLGHVRGKSHVKNGKGNTFIDLLQKNFWSMRMVYSSWVVCLLEMADIGLTIIEKRFCSKNHGADYTATRN